MAAELAKGGVTLVGASAAAQAGATAAERADAWATERAEPPRREPPPALEDARRLFFARRAQAIPVPAVGFRSRGRIGAEGVAAPAVLGQASGPLGRQRERAGEEGGGGG
jgi:hypothetical protein